MTPLALRTFVVGGLMLVLKKLYHKNLSQEEIAVKLNEAQNHQLADMVKATRITKGVNKGKRKDGISMCIRHFDLRSFNRLIHLKLVTVSEYNSEEWFATELGYQVWVENK